MGRVRFPEEQLTTYLRVFIPDGRIPDVLDQVAQAAVEADVRGGPDASVQGSLLRHRESTA